MKYLIENGADVNKKTGNGEEGGTALWWAKRNLKEEHPIIAYLENVGALEIGPDL